MKLYHGSPKKLKELVPNQAKGLGEFQNQKAVFLTDSFDRASLYSFGKFLKGKTAFGLTTKNNLIVLGNYKLPDKSYVYEVNVDGKKENPKSHEYAFDKPIKKFILHQVKLEDYQKFIQYAKSEKDFCEKFKNP